MAGGAYVGAPDPASHIRPLRIEPAVDETAQVIVAQHVTPNGPEVQELLPAVEMIERLLGEYPDQVVADAG